mgnify:CR=1 FL=1
MRERVSALAQSEPLQYCSSNDDLMDALVVQVQKLMFG